TGGPGRPGRGPCEDPPPSVAKEPVDREPRGGGGGRPQTPRRLRQTSRRGRPLSGRIAMQITTDEACEPLEMHVSGRLDNDSSDYFNTSIDECIRKGRHSVVVHLTEVSYVSSAGLGALLRAHKKLQAVRGFFGVASTSPAADEVIRLTGVGKLLLCDVE